MCAKDYYDHDDETDQFDEFLRETSPNSPGKEQILAPVVPQSSCGLYHEFSLLNTNIPHIDVQETDAAKRKAQVKITANGHIVLLLVTFPFGYPDINAPPEFTYCPGTSLDVNLSATLMKKIKVTAHERVRKGRPCLEQCLRTLVTALKKSSSGSEKGHMRLQSPRLEGALSGALHDACVPFPKTSGARFGHVNMLVTFSCPLNRRNIGLKPQNITPRALSALSGGYLGNVMGTKPMLYAQRDASTSALYTDKLTRQRKVSTRFVNSSVVVYDVSKMLAVQKDIALRYKIMFEDKLKMCQHNLEIAREFLRPDLIQLWSMAEMLASELDKIETDTALIPSTKLFAANLLQSLINTALKNFDVQTATMLCCAFGGFYESPNNNTQGQLMTVAPSKSIDYTLTDYRYQLPHSEPVTPSSDTWSLVSTANTAINALDLKSPTIDTTDSTQPNTFWLEPSPQPPSDSTFFTDSKCQTYDRFKLAYADILNRWQLLVPKTQVLKYLISSELVQTEPNSTGESMLAAFSFECGNCRNSKCLPPACKGCKQYLLKCTFCRLPVKGMANLCLKCGHGGHTEHLLYWFEKSDVCASGCGCYCLLEESNFY